MREEDYRTQDDDEAGCTEQCQGCAMHQTLATGFRQCSTPAPGVLCQGRQACGKDWRYSSVRSVSKPPSKKPLS